MTDPLIGSCKAALKHLIATDRVLESEDPYAVFSEGLLNFHAHYCVDDYSSPWCWHEKVYNMIINMVSNTLMYACSLHRRRMASRTM